MGKLKRKLEFLEIGMQRIKTKLQKLQQDPTLTPSISTVGIRPKQFVDQHDYHIMKQGNAQDTYDHDRYIGPYCTIQQQIWADTMLSTQIYEEQRQFEKQIKWVENKRSNEYHLNSMRNQTIPYQFHFVRKDREDSLTYFGVPYRTEMQAPKLDEFTLERQAT